MIKTKDILLGGLALYGGVTMVKQGAMLAIEKITNNISYQTGKAKVDISNIKHGSIKITIPIVVVNNNPFSIIIDRFIAQSYYGKVPLGLINIPQKIDLVSGVSQMIDLEFVCDIQQTISGIANAIASGSLAAILEDIYINGYIFILSNSMTGQIQLPISLQIPILP